MDIGEMKNLADSEPEKCAELSAKLTAWSEEIEALIPEPNPGYAPWEEREASGLGRYSGSYEPGSSHIRR